MEFLKSIGKVIKTIQIMVITIIALYAVYVKVSSNNPVEDFFFNLKSIERVQKFEPPKNTLNKVDNTIETENGILEIGQIKFYKNTTVVFASQEKGTSMVIDYKFTPKKAGIKVNSLFDKVVKVEQFKEDGTAFTPEAAVFFGGAMDQSIIDRVNKGIQITTEADVGKTIEGATALYVLPGEVKVKFGQTVTPYFVSN